MKKGDEMGKKGDANTMVLGGAGLATSGL